MTLPVTGSFAAALTALFLVLSVRVIIYRRVNKVSLGDGGDPVLEARIRAQANFAEYVPLSLMLMAISEIEGHSVIWLLLVGAMLLAGRILHGVNFSFGLRRMPLRVGGMILTLMALGLGAVLALPF
jgi:uncharacterized protein